MVMKKAMINLLALLALAGPSAGQSNREAAAVGEMEPRQLYRVSALLQGGDGLQVGFVDAISGQSFYLAEGQTRHGITVRQVDFAAERVRLEIDGVPRELQLADDPASREVAVPVGAAAAEEETFTDEELGIDQHHEISTEPSAGLKSMMAQFPEAVPPDFGAQSNVIQQMMAAHPEVAAQSRLPQGTHGPGIEQMMKRYPELTNQLIRAADGAPPRGPNR